MSYVFKKKKNKKGKKEDTKSNRLVFIFFMCGTAKKYIKLFAEKEQPMNLIASEGEGVESPPSQGRIDPPLG